MEPMSMSTSPGPGQRTVSFPECGRYAHLGGGTREARARANRVIVEERLSIIRGKIPKNLVNREICAERMGQSANKEEKKMKIQDVASFPVSYKLDRPFANSSERHQRRSTTLVKITADEGMSGWGEAYGPPLGVSRLIQTYLKPRLIGQDPFRLEYLWFQLQTHKGIPKGAMGGIDLALWDLKARALNVPLYELLGGRNTAVITPYATGFFFSEDEPESTKYLEAEVEGALSKKFRALKMKIGFGKDRDIRRMRRVRELVGDDIDLMVDANQAYDYMTCVELIPCLTDVKVRWLEEPMPWQSFEGYKELRKKVTFALAGGEAEYDYQGFFEAIRDHVVDVIQPDLAASGGLTHSRRSGRFGGGIPGGLPAARVRDDPGAARSRATDGGDDEQPALDALSAAGDAGVGHDPQSDDNRPGPQPADPDGWAAPGA